MAKKKQARDLGPGGEEYPPGQGPGRYFQVSADNETATIRIVSAIDAAEALRCRRQVNGEWEDVRVMNPWHSNNAPGVRDFECPMDMDVMYEMDGLDENGNVIETLQSGPVRIDGSVTNDWLRPITRPLDGMRIWVESYMQQERPGRVATFVIMNRADRVAVTMERRLPMGTLICVTMTRDEHDRMLKVIHTGEPICFLSEGVNFVHRQYLVVFGADEQRYAAVGIEPSRRWVLQVEEIGYPAGSTADWSFVTWDDVTGRGDSWSETVENYPSWLSLPETPPAPPPSPGEDAEPARMAPVAFGA
jgi:hypothetical protein